MGQLDSRTAQTSRGLFALSPWTGDGHIYSISNMNLGNNPISKIEIVSSLNFLNLAHAMYHYNNTNCHNRFYPKVYLGAIQNMSAQWIIEQFTGCEKYEKSGSC